MISAQAEKSVEIQKVIDELTDVAKERLIHYINFLRYEQCQEEQEEQEELEDIAYIKAHKDDPTVSFDEVISEIDAEYGSFNRN